MPWESIGSVDTGDMPHEEAWILSCLGMAKSYVIFVCGEAPDDTKLEIMWHEHELGNHPSLGVWYDLEEPSDYINACEAALDVFNEAVSWHDLKTHFMEQKETEEGDSEDSDDDDYEEDFEEEDIEED